MGQKAESTVDLVGQFEAQEQRISRIKKRNTKDLDEILSDEVRIKEIVSHAGPKIVESLYQKALLTTIAIQIESQVHAVIKSKDHISNGIRVDRRSTSHHRSFMMFDTINYRLARKDRHQLCISMTS